MSKVQFKGTEIKLRGKIPTVGTQAPNFILVKEDLSEVTLESYAGKKKILMVVPSLDTGVCAMQTKKFNEQLASKTDVVALVISSDLPFAMKRFCGAENIKNIISVSDFRYKNVLQAYNLEMTEGPLRGLTARAVFILDTNDVIRYVELVPEVTQEPNYEAALAALN